MDAAVAADLERRMHDVEALVALAVQSGLAADLEEARNGVDGLRWALTCALAVEQEPLFRERL